MMRNMYIYNFLKKIFKYREERNEKSWHWFGVPDTERAFIASLSLSLKILLILSLDSLPLIAISPAQGSLFFLFLLISISILTFRT